MQHFTSDRTVCTLIPRTILFKNKMKQETVAVKNYLLFCVVRVYKCTSGSGESGLPNGTSCTEYVLCNEM